MAGFETASAAASLDASVKMALTTIAGRHEQFGEALRASAGSLVRCDLLAAHLLKSLGDLNERPEK